MAKVLREIIKIDEDLCDGCGDCITSCAEGALEIVDGKARLKGEILCDGAGACLGSCPTGALTIEKRESEEYSEETVAVNLKASQPAQPIAVGSVAAGSFPMAPQGGCPGSAMRQWQGQPLTEAVEAPADSTQPCPTARPSRLTQWPVQLMLVPPTAPFFKNADLLIAADCVPFAFPNFHERFLKGKALVVGCPKLDNLQLYFEKLTEIFRGNGLHSVEVLKMEVPCCGGIAQATVEARKQAGVECPITITTIGVQGDLLEKYQA